MAQVAGIVLGAGGSRRLGRPKQTLPFGDTTLLGRVMRDAEASSLDPLVLVVGGAADEALEPLSLSRARVTHNDSYGEGCASSLLAGLDAIGNCDAAMLLLGDMPGVDAPLIEELRRDWEEHRPRMALTSYSDRPGHPFVFAAEAFGDLRTLHGDKAVWKIVERDPSSARRVPVERELPPDVDTWDDYEAACRRLGVPVAAQR
jgi:molybdenum cofactor cytidylyltransferase